jgi:hypothetical protein
MSVTRMALRASVCLAFMIAIVPAVFGADTTKKKQSNPIAGRYLYVVDGGGGLTKFDTVTGKSAIRIDLGTRTGALKIPPARGKGAQDGCLASQAVYDRATARFYTVVAKQYQAGADGTKDFEVLAFTIPGVELAGHWSAGDHINEDSGRPMIESVAAGRKPTIVAANAAPNVETKLDVVALGLSEQPFENRIIERSGDVVLLDLLSGDSQKGIGLETAHLQTKKLVPLPRLADFIHLTPGGRYVVAKRMDGVEFEVYDTKTGAKVKTVTAPKGFEMNEFLAIAPTGKIVFNAGGGFRLVDLGMRFANVPVTGIGGKDNCLSFFFASE